MAQSADLMGLGMPPAMADRLSNNVQNVTATGTSSGTAILVKGGHTYVVTTGASATGIILSPTESVGDIVYVTVPTATSAVVYPPAGALFNTAASTSATVAQYATTTFIRLSSTLYAVK